HYTDSFTGSDCLHRESAERDALQLSGLCGIPLDRGYCFCCGVLVAAVVNARPSTVILACGAYISSQLCSDQKTSFSGAGLNLFFAELSNSVTTVTLLPAGIFF